MMRTRRGRAEKDNPVREPGKSSIDWMLLLITAVLVILGLLMQYSASSYDLSLIKKQGMFAAGGFVAIFVMSVIPERFYYRVSPAIYVLAAGLTGITYVIGKQVKGATRWIQISSFTFQPSELLKAAVIMATAAIIVKYINQINNISLKETRLRQDPETKKGGMGILEPVKGYILMILCIGAAAFVVAFATRDLGTAIIIFAIGYIMMLMVSPRIKYLIGILCAVGVAGIGLVLAFPYRRGRISAWINLEENSTDLGYQIRQGLYAIGSGGLFGKGLGKSIQKDVIPEPHTDMIFSIVCEELGIIGGIILVLLFVLLILRLKSIYDQLNDLYGKLIVIGVISHIAIQTFVNMAVLTNLIPNTGVPLPFISYGGTSLLCLLGEIGLVIAVRRAGILKERNNEYKAEYFRAAAKER